MDAGNNYLFILIVNSDVIETIIKFTEHFCSSEQATNMIVTKPQGIYYSL